jgi:hypothetical protein
LIEQQYIAQLYISQGHLIEAVAWNKTRLNETTTQGILIGTSKGKFSVAFLNCFTILNQKRNFENHALWEDLLHDRHAV